ncbi:hypothetical protein ACTG9Q_13200 [Actinokineospora sp. 24-640]
MTEDKSSRSTSARVRELALRGELADTVAAAAPDECRRLRIEAYQIAQPVVFQHLTRKLERGRGHYRCATSVFRMDDACLHNFHDDMDAVIDHLFRYARSAIQNLEGWIRTRLTAATVDAHRKRRGVRGALQRPRVPGWLAARLDGDPGLMAVAIGVLDFVGNEVDLGPEVWPTERWAERRAAAGDVDFKTALRGVRRDVATVLAAMRARPAWYADYVERPLGHKRVAAIPLPRLSADSDADIPERTDSGDPLTELAELAVAAIEDRVGQGQDLRAAVVVVVAEVFGGGTAVGPAADLGPVVDARLADDAVVDRIIAVVQDALARR